MRRDDTKCPLDIALLTTGGTIEKSYDPFHGVFSNDASVLDAMLAELNLEGVELHRHAVMNKDSLDMTEGDHAAIVDAALSEAGVRDGVVIIHGTDRLSVTGEVLASAAVDLSVPIVLTGAMLPWVLSTTDAKQNLTEALLAVQLLDPGVYVCMHNRALQFPGIVKDLARLRFERACDCEHEDA
jgi:L-asparaginase